MPESAGIPDPDSPIIDHARADFPLLEATLTVAEALDRIRREGIGERVIYFYAVDENRKLVGVLPTRRFLTADPAAILREIMIPRVVAIPAKATVLDACEFFVLYKFFAFPVVDEQRRVIGVVDVSLFAEEILQAGEREDQVRAGRAEGAATPARDATALARPVRDDIFEALGFHLEQIRGASPWLHFRFRFPWLLVTVAGGTICALLSGFFEATLAHSLVIAFFLTMVLGLNESVSAQSMTVTIQSLRSASVTWRWFVAAFRRELVTAILLGLGCGFFVGLIVMAWRHDARAAGVIGGSVAFSLVSACLIGLSVPSLLHRFKLDPKIAAGPITLALADILALVIYFTTAWLVLR